LALIAVATLGCIINVGGCLNQVRHERKVDLSRPVAAETALEVVNDDGAITVQGQETSNYLLAATITAYAANAERAQQWAEQTQVDLVSEGGTLKVVIQRPANLHNEWVQVDIHLTVPRKIDVDLRTSDGHIDIEDLTGTLKAHTSDGAIMVKQAQGPIEVQTSDGHVECVRVEGPRLYARTSDGSIRLEECRSQECEVQTSDGRISGEGIFSPKLNCRTSDGSIDIRYDPQAQAVVFVDLTTHDGQIQMVCPPQVSAVIDAHVGDGHISTELPITIEGKIGKDLKGTLGKGEGRIILRTSDGSIQIR
jgi:DUF4097 and DUF4098 domain-containing protein YvlB